MPSGYEKYSDEELITLLRAGQADVVDYLVGKYKYLVRKKTRALYLAGGDQEDLLQEGMLGLFKAIKRYDPEREASFLTFASLCVDRQLYTAIESSNTQKHAFLNAFVSLSEPDADQKLQLVDVCTPEEILIGQEDGETLLVRIRESLSKMENQVLDLYLEGNDYRQIAEKLKKPPKAIDNCLQRIRAKARAVKEEKEQHD